VRFITFQSKKRRLSESKARVNATIPFDFGSDTRIADDRRRGLAWFSGTWPRSPRSVLRQYGQVINEHDFDLLVPLISPDCTFWFSSGSHHGLDEARLAFEKTWDNIREEEYGINNEVWIIETAEGAVCTYSFKWSGLVGGERRSGSGRGTSCFRVEDGEWKLMHEHLSPFPVSPT